MKAKKSKKSFQESLDSAEGPKDLLRLLDSYNDRINSPNPNKDSDNAVDFLRRWMMSDDYKSQIGGAAMMRSEIGDEESAMYEKIGRAGDELKFERLKPGQYGSSRALNEIGRYLDYRQPVFSTTVDKNKTDDTRGAVVHELYHTVAEPTNIGKRYEDNLDSRYYGKERTGKVSEFPEGVGANDTQPVITPFGPYRSKNDAAKHIQRYGFAVENDPNRYAESIKYFRNPTELSARTRDLTNFLQNKGEIPKDQFSLEYDDILKAYEMGNEAAKEFLYALGVYTSDGSKYALRKDLIPESKEKYNRYLKGKL
jgi:hypothetical protein